MEENKMTISYQEFKDDIEAMSTETVTVHWLGQDIVIKKHLTLQEVLMFVSNVIDVCYQGDGEILTYTPEVQAYAVQHTLVSLYTNIDLTDNDEDESNDNKFRAYDFITKSGIVDIVFKHIDIKQYDAMMQAIASKIKYINASNAMSATNEVISLNSALSELLPQLNNLLNNGGSENLEQLIQTLQIFNQDSTIKQLAMEQAKHE